MAEWFNAHAWKMTSALNPNPQSQVVFSSLGFLSARCRRLIKRKVSEFRDKFKCAGESG